MPTVATTRLTQEPKHMRIPLSEMVPRYTVPRLVVSHDYIVVTLGTRAFAYTLQGHLIHSFDCNGPGSDREAQVYQDTLFTWYDGKKFSTLSIVNLELGEGEDSTLTKTWPKEPFLVTSSRSYPLHPQAIILWRVPRIGERNPNTGNHDTSEITHEYSKMYTTLHRFGVMTAKGRIAITGGFNGTVGVWDIITGECQWFLIGHKKAVSAVNFDSCQIYSGSEDSTVRIWDMQTGECRHILESHTKYITGIGISPSFLLSCDTHWTLCIWDPVSYKLNYQILDFDLGWVTKYFEHDGRRLLFCNKYSLELRNVLDNRVVHVFPELQDVEHIIAYRFVGKFW
ncbi:WD40-repeat-containing domain protein [Gymnopilus junonius]|uniref:WD40-repeat-containing domain protein n=1 Tax=Gymnopilus junonius TaxID=109634 RepID=A0A9P5NA68_GYMJU|nr:WD40-repeat-containing domain protein [Gymnopilus junonius]